VDAGTSPGPGRGVLKRDSQGNCGAAKLPRTDSEGTRLQLPARLERRITFSELKKLAYEMQPIRRKIEPACGGDALATLLAKRSESLPTEAASGQQPDSPETPSTPDIDHDDGTSFIKGAFATEVQPNEVQTVVLPALGGIFRALASAQ